MGAQGAQWPKTTVSGRPQVGEAGTVHTMDWRTLAANGETADTRVRRTA
jgi:hypothetical protein